MEVTRGVSVWASFWNFLCFFPFFIALLILALIKGVIMFPVILVILTVGISGIVLLLWPIHCFYTYYCILSSKQFGPALKLLLCICLPAVLISWPPLGIVCSVLSGAAYGLFYPIFATFRAVEQGNTSKFSHCICDGTWSAVEGSFTMIRDFADFSYHSYFSIMDDLRYQEGKHYEIRLLYVSVALVAGMLGVVVDLPVISTLALCKSPYMLVKGWHRLLQDCVGRKGPFLETICVPFAGIAVLVWPLVVAAAVLCSIFSTFFLGAYAAVIVYQERSIWFGLCYIVASVSIYDEYINDILDLPEGSCFPRPRYRKNATLQPAYLSSRTSPRNPPSGRASLSSQMLELKPLEVADALFKECGRLGEVLVSDGTINLTDIEEKKKRRECERMLSVGLPAYCILQALVRSARADSGGIMLSDDVEITLSNRPKDMFFEWFLNPLLIIKEHIKAVGLSEREEHYLGKLVLFSGNATRLNDSHIGPEPQPEAKRAELEALGRRLIGITKSVSRYPTFRRRFDQSMGTVLAQLAKNSGSDPTRRSTTMFARIFTRKNGRSNGQQDSPLGS